MKKSIFTLAVVFSIMVFSACKKESNVQPQLKAKALSDKGNLGQIDLDSPPPADSDKGNLGQIDGDGDH